MSSASTLPLFLISMLASPPSRRTNSSPAFWSRRWVRAKSWSVTISASARDEPVIQRACGGREKRWASVSPSSVRLQRRGGGFPPHPAPPQAGAGAVGGGAPAWGGGGG